MHTHTHTHTHTLSTTIVHVKTNEQRSIRAGHSLVRSKQHLIGATSTTAAFSIRLIGYDGKISAVLLVLYPGSNQPHRQRSGLRCVSESQ